jgi:Domain of unknown function (DUF4390)
LARLRDRLDRLMRLFAACALLVLAISAFAQSSGAEMTQFQLERTEEGILLSSAVRFDLPPVIEDALQKGIPMFFVAEAVLYRDRWYWYDREIAHARRHMRLSYQPLTRRWRLTLSPSVIGNSGVALGQNFESQEEALAAVQRISRWKIAEPGDVSPDERYNVEFRFRLDVSQLPRPFQIGAVGQADWNISVARNQRLLDTPR